MLPMTTLNDVLVLYDGQDEEAVAISKAVAVEYDEAGQAQKPPAALLDVTTIAIADCIGCFGCWVRTPGLCVLTRDEGNQLCRAVLEAQTVVMVSRITWGGYSASIKTAADRMLPLLHPDFRRVNGEMHHRMRYSRMPLLRAVGFGGGTTAEEETFRNYTAAHRVNFGCSAGTTTIWTGNAREVFA